MRSLLAFAWLNVQLAWRNLWRNYRRTLIMLAAIVLGAWSMIFMASLARGMVTQMVRDGLRALPGHVQIHHPEYREDPTVVNSMPPLSSELRSSLESESVVAWTSRVRVPAVITSERDTRGVTLVGIDPERERLLSFVADDLAEGRFLEGSDDKGLIVGRKLLERLETDLGKRVVVMSQDPENDVAERGFRIVGVFDSDLAVFEEGFVFAGEAIVQQMLRIGEQASEIAIIGDDYRDAERLAADVAVAAGGELQVEPWMELDPMLQTMMGLLDAFILVFVVIIFMALSFGLVNTLVMAVFERTREIGLMLALGVAPRSIVAQVIVECVLLLLVGLAVGNLLAWLTVSALSDGIDISMVAEGMADYGVGSVITPRLGLRDLAIANLTVLILGFLASLSPALRASRLEPVKALSES